MNGIGTQIKERIKNRYLRTLLSFTLHFLLPLFLFSGVYFLFYGMFLIGIPHAENVEQVIITHSEIPEKQAEIMEPEDIELSVKLTRFLNYSLFQRAPQEEPVITITFCLADGSTAVVSAGRRTVWWKGNAHALKEEELFVNLTENFFFSE